MKSNPLRPSDVVPLPHSPCTHWGYLMRMHCCDYTGFIHASPMRCAAQPRDSSTPAVPLLCPCVCHPFLPPGYTGANCSDYICANSSCGNGTVQHAREGGKLVCRCDCFDGYLGPQCQYLTCSGLKEQHQLHNGCYNEAPCTDHDTGFTCECLEGTTGTWCELTIQHCQPGVCNETGTRECRNLPQGPRCMCRSGFTGDTCSETKTPCKNFPCKNGGVCEGRGLNDFLCMCPSPFTGRTCGKCVCVCVCVYFVCTLCVFPRVFVFVPTLCVCLCVLCVCVCVYSVCVFVCLFVLGMCVCVCVCVSPSNCFPLRYSLQSQTVRHVTDHTVGWLLMAVAGK